MPRLSLALLLSAALCSTAAQAAGSPVTASAGPACPALLQHTVPRLQDEAPQDLCQYAGKVLLVVNTASYCGFTGQYKGLEDLYARYRDKGLVVLGFPSNDFAQETGSNTDIAEFCENTFGVRFPMFVKSHVKGSEALPLYRQLASASQGQTPRWNFHKYLVSRSGKVVGSYGSSVEPQNKALVQAIEQQLGAPR